MSQENSAAPSVAYVALKAAEEQFRRIRDYRNRLAQLAGEYRQDKEWLRTSIEMYAELRTFVESNLPDESDAFEPTVQTRLNELPSVEELEKTIATLEGLL